MNKDIYNVLINTVEERHGNPKLFQKSTFIRPFDLGRPKFAEPPRKKRRFIYPPSAAECRKKDIFFRNAIDPRHECENYMLLSEYLSEMGKIKTRAETQLTVRSQRLLGKAVRRAKMMGVIPVLYNMMYRLR